MKQSVDNYFQSAREWADDVYLEAVASRNRYRFACLGSFLIIALLLLGFIFLLPLQHTQLVILHHMDDGTTWAELLKQKNIVPNKMQSESDIVRYVINRESYSAAAYGHHYSLVNLLSNKKVAQEYQRAQSVANPKSPINHFKRRITRKTHVENVIFLKNSAHGNLAQVNFIITDHDHLTGRHKRRSLLALISWKYRGKPKDPESRWKNWDGFTVIHYAVQQRNL